VDVERLFEPLPGDDLVEEAQFVLNNGKVAGKTELVDLIADDETRRQVAARILGVQSDDPDLRVRLLQALDSIEEQLRAEPGWIEDVPEPEPVVTHDLEATTVIRNGVQTEIAGSEFRQLVEDASRNAVVWSPEETGVQYETDTPWGSWAAADQARSYRSAYADDATWPESVTRRYWVPVVTAWNELGYPQDVLDAMLGGETELTDDVQQVLRAMEDLADVLADEPEGSIRTVAYALARKIAWRRAEIKAEEGRSPVEVLYEHICWYLGVDGTRGWDAELPSADGLRNAIETWVNKITSKKMWGSQAAAIKALVLHNASPYEARQAARAAFGRA
jgi:hypothetical protein